MPDDAPVAAEHSVMAVVLTFNAPDSARGCLASIREQSAAVERTLVVDNASTPPFAAGAAGPDVEVLRLPENVGPAGGYAAGLRAFLDSGLGWVWLVDDDSAPRPDVLALQLSAADARAEPTAFLATMVDRDTGEEANTHGWCGVLIPREIVAAVGAPIEEFFWWSEDTEYLQWRIPESGFALVRCDDAVVEVGLARAERAKPAWKFYYETRNQVYYRLRVQRQSPDGPRRRHLTARVRVWRAGRTVVKLGGRALLQEPEGRARKFSMVTRGAVDGVRGRLGRTVPVEIADRPVGPGPASASTRRVDPEEPLDVDQA